ncbi:hypothetical protein GCM10007205_13780 [Oxalicibacterium flavum]|uniref:STAS domain-containing protein n=1 Tax=Oxalicibacterium flavum TaxID=179467 RepID=A0A8J2UM76_9BURK|nr:STAS domain-containing protein [Oxalicibacterium flavum]GGC05886.1 hypothetical protein GCM10007205_13780 [Oxalicibacterium flavum]
MYQPSTSLTFANARPALEAGLRAIAQGERAFDFGATTTVDSSAVAVLLAWQRAAKERGGSLVLHNLPANLASLLSLYDVAPLLETAPARADLPHH